MSSIIMVLGYSEITLLSNALSQGAKDKTVLGYSEITLLSNGRSEKQRVKVGFRLL